MRISGSSRARTAGSCASSATPDKGTVISTMRRAAHSPHLRGTHSSFQEICTIPYRGTSLIRNSPPSPLGTPQDPGYSLAVGSQEGGVFHERGSPELFIEPFLVTFHFCRLSAFDTFCHRQKAFWRAQLEVSHGQPHLSGTRARFYEIWTIVHGAIWAIFRTF